jgi:hypothetical protein
VDALVGPAEVTITDPKWLARFDLQAGDRILAVNGHPPVGGIFLALVSLPRDPDAAVVRVDVDRHGQRTTRMIVAR